MRNGAYTLASIAALVGLVLLTVGSSDGVETALGTVLLIVAPLLMGIGKAIDVLGYVRDGAADPDE
ncbi:MAG: hypothetical protein ABEL97_15100 [Salinibacter sp.]